MKANNILNMMKLAIGAAPHITEMQKLAAITIESKNGATLIMGVASA